MDAQQARIKARYKKRQQDMVRLKKGGRYLGLTMGAMVLTIYGYSMYMIKQEGVFREIDEEIQRESAGGLKS